jgi:hypothetical protein
MVPTPVGGAAAGLRRDRVQAIFYMSHENSKKRKEEEKKKRKETGRWLSRLMRRAPGPPGCSARQGAPHSCRDHGPDGPDGPGGVENSLEVAVHSPAFGAVARCPTFAVGFSWAVRSRLPWAACASDCVDRNNCVRFLGVFSFFLFISGPQYDAQH